jgi:hypothetical protein
MAAILLALLLQAPATPAPTVNLPVSLERVRDGLERPNRFAMPPPRRPKRPTFTLTIDEQWSMPGEAWDDLSLAPLWVRPSMPPTHFELLSAVTPEEVRASTLHPCCDVLPIVGAISKRITSAKQARAKREVERTMRAAGIRR